MTNFPTPNIITNLVSGGDLSAIQYRPVAISADNAVLAANTSSRKKAIGVLMNTPNSAVGSFCEVATVGGGAKVIAGETIAVGDPLTQNASSRAVVAQSGDYVFGYALQAAVNNDVFACLVVNQSFQPETQELTATGTVTARVQSLELNNTSTVVAATIASAANHEGLFIVKNTSASGTAAHTLTLTSGTFNGTNNVATLNAPNEALAVYFDSAGNGTVIANVGSVGLS